MNGIEPEASGEEIAGRAVGGRPVDDADLDDAFGARLLQESRYLRPGDPELLGDRALPLTELVLAG